jgi:hypothetical protein
MTTTELLRILKRECPNGVSFAPMAVRLLRQKVPFEDRQIEDLKAVMFQLKSGLWFSCEMISDDESRLEFEEKAMEWLQEHGCFSVERLFRDFNGVFRHIATPEDCATFLRNLGFTVTAWKKGDTFCSLPPPTLDDSLAAISETIAGWLEEADGTLTFHKIEQEMPQLTANALESIRTQLLPEVHETEVSGVRCWCSADAISLPEDFPEKLTTVVDTLVALNKKVSVATLSFALDLFYRTHFREEYALPDNSTFMRVCAKHYHGRNYLFPAKFRMKGKEFSASNRRVRSPNTRFDNLGIPVGTELLFTKDPDISCVVSNDSNQVEYEGKTWTISRLAMHLLGVSSANGFWHFSYRGETLRVRRLRLEQTGKQDEYQAGVMSSHNKMKEEEGGTNV